MAWVADSIAAKRLNTIESLVARVLTGVSTLQMNADVSGTVKSPKLAVSSNLDRVVADQMRSVIGAQVAAAEAKVRARVDSLVDEKAAPVKARIADLRTNVDKRVADARAQLDAEKQKLDAQLKTLSGGLVGLP
jgi:autotransporter translocation and assembly factor TamB